MISFILTVAGQLNFFVVGCILVNLDSLSIRFGMKGYESTLFV